MEMHDDGRNPHSFLLKKQRPNNSSDDDCDDDNEDAPPLSAGGSEDDSDSDADSNSDDDSHFVMGLGEVGTVFESSSADDGSTGDNEISIGQYDQSLAPTNTTKPPYSDECGLPQSYRFQIDLADLLGRHRTDLKLHDELIALVKSYSSNNQLGFSPSTLKDREGFIKSLEKALNHCP